jgi:DNA-binding NarL/FixJ family response regulator
VADVRVLVVDDVEPFRRAIAAVVSATDGFAVAASASTGEASLLAVARLRPDLVLMDVNLPGMDGLEAARRITAGAAPPVVILLSTYDQEEFDITGCGASAYLAKATFGPDRLAAAWTVATSPPTHSAALTAPATPPVPTRRHRSEC